MQERIKPAALKGRDAENYLGCGRTALHRLEKAGEVESFLDGRIRKYTVRSLDDYIARRVVASKTEKKRRAPLNPHQKAAMGVQ